MHPLAGNIAEGLIDHSLPHYPVYPRKGGAFDFDGEVALARTIIAAMAVVRCAVVYHGKAGGGERGGEQRLHFDMDRSFCHKITIPISRQFRQGQNHVRAA
jgi:hypothetical protein